MREPGIILTESDAGEHLRGLKRYKDLYQNVEDQRLAAIGQLGEYQRMSMSDINQRYGTDVLAQGNDFAESMTKAFEASRTGRQSLMNTNLGTGARLSAISDLEKDVASAYDAYVNNYIANRNSLTDRRLSDEAQLQENLMNRITELDTNAQAAVGTIDKMLAAEASNWSNLLSAPRQYLEYISTNPNVTSNPDFANYFKTTYTGGVEESKLITSDEWDAMMYETLPNGVKKPKQELLDFYSHMLYNTDDIDGTPGFGAWLNKTDSELYNFYLQNGNEVFGELGDVNADRSKPAAKTYTPTSTFANNKNFGTVRRFISNENGVQINVFDDLVLNGLNAGDLKESKSENFVAEYHGHRYKLKIQKDAPIADDSVLNDIKGRTGTIENGKLYAYGNKLYYATTDKGVELREVEFRSGKDAFWKTLQDDAEMLKQGK